MLKANENDFSYRFGDNGPKYLIQGKYRSWPCCHSTGPGVSKPLSYDVRRGLLCIRR